MAENLTIREAAAGLLLPSERWPGDFAVLVDGVEICQEPEPEFANPDGFDPAIEILCTIGRIDELVNAILAAQGRRIDYEDEDYLHEADEIEQAMIRGYQFGKALVGHLTEASNGIPSAD